jgi:hypothetical protein
MGNCRPKKENVQKTISYTPPLSGTIGGIVFAVAPANFTHTKNYWYEVNPVSDTRKFIQNAQKQETYTTTSINVPSGETNDGDVTFTNQTFTQQKYETDVNGNATPVFDRECRADYSYDEQYFYHIFEWPTTHSLSRVVGGYQQTTSSTITGNTALEGQPSNSTTSGLSSVSLYTDTVTSSLSLNKVDSVITGAPSNSFIYHGGTDDSKIFFTYETASATATVVKVGDVINGWTVSKVLNYVVDKALRKRVSNQSTKGKTPSYVYVGSKTGISLGDGVIGDGIASGTTVTAISSTDNKITLSTALTSTKIKSVVFTSSAVNKVNLSTLCYAELSGGSANFVVDTVYNATGSGASINVRAGKGISNRSAVVGIYFSSGKKTVEYSPVFYNKSRDCDQVITYEKEADYIVGTITLNDGTELLANQLLCVNPKTNTAVMVNEVYWKNFNRPVDKTKLLYWIDYAVSTNSNYDKLEQIIIDDVKSLLQGKKVVKCVDDVCGNQIEQEQYNVYNPYKELSLAKTLVDSVSQIAYDPCASERSNPAYSADELKSIVSNNIQNAISSSFIAMPEEMYKQFVTNDNSLMNNIMKAIDSIEGSVLDKQISNIPASVKGENKSSVRLVHDKFTRLPPKFSRVDYLVSDLTFTSDTDVILDDASNKITFTISSIPRWTGTVSSGSYSGDSFTTANGITVTTSRTNGYIDNIVTTAGTIPQPTTPSIIGLPVGSTSTAARTWIAPTAGDDSLSARPYPFTIWNNITNQQKDYSKTFSFRVEEVSNYLGECLDNKGNSFLDYPVYATLTSNLSSVSTTISVNDTSQFLSSGYLIIPKYLEKKEQSKTGNVESYFYYLGEEIIYYNDKTNTSFNNCTRAVYDTTSTFELVTTAGDFIEGVKYEIKTLGSTNWQSIGAPEGATVGTIFTASGMGSGTGDAYTFESTITPFENSPEVNAVIHSYDKGFKLAQFWPYKTL